jgi:hypothetical protein
MSTHIGSNGIRSGIYSPKRESACRGQGAEPPVVRRLCGIELIDDNREAEPQDMGGWAGLCYRKDGGRRASLVVERLLLATLFRMASLYSRAKSDTASNQLRIDLIKVKEILLRNLHSRSEFFNMIQIDDHLTCFDLLNGIYRTITQAG